MRKPTISAVIERPIGAFLLLLLYAPFSWGQTQTEEETEEITPEVVEEITVYGERSIIVLRKEFELAQENMFELFNTLNSDDEFDIECEYEQRLGSRRWHHVCTPKFATRQINNEGAGRMVWNHRESEPRFVSLRNQRMNERLWEEMAALINDSPELREAFIDLSDAKDAIEAEREKRRND